MAELTARVASRLPGMPVRAAYLDHTAPTPTETLRQLAGQGCEQVHVLPLLFAPGFHLRTDLPASIAAARETAPGLVAQIGPTLVDLPDDVVGADLLLDALDERMAGVVRSPAAVVLVAAGSSAAVAREMVHRLAQRWGARRGVPAAAAFASGPGDRPEAAVHALSAAAGVRTGDIGVGLLFLADGFLPGRATEAVTAAGAACTDVLGAAPQLAELIVRRQLAVVHGMRPRPPHPAATVGARS